MFTRRGVIIALLFLVSIMLLLLMIRFAVTALIFVLFSHVPLRPVMLSRRLILIR